MHSNWMDSIQKAIFCLKNSEWTFYAFLQVIIAFHLDVHWMIQPKIEFLIYHLNKSEFTLSINCPQTAFKSFKSKNHVAFDCLAILKIN